MQFPHTRKISPEKENLCIPWILCEKKYQREKWNIVHTEFTEYTELFLRNEHNICYQKQLESTEFVVDFVTTAGAVGTDDEDDDKRKSENGKVKSRNEVCDSSSASVEYERKGNKNFAPFAPFA